MAYTIHLILNMFYGNNKLQLLEFGYTAIFIWTDS